MEDTQIKEFVKNHPKLLGVLFGLAMMSTQVGSALGNVNTSFGGP